MRGRGPSGGKEWKSAAVELRCRRVWGALDSSSLASFAGSVDRSFRFRGVDCKGCARHIVNVQLVFGTNFSFATLWVLRDEFGAEDPLRLHALDHLGHV